MFVQFGPEGQVIPFLPCYATPASSTVVFLQLQLRSAEADKLLHLGNRAQHLVRKVRTPRGCVPQGRLYEGERCQERPPGVAVHQMVVSDR